MGKVEMSLQDYDKLKSELSIYEEIVNAITSPKVNDWDLKWYIEHPSSSMPISADSIFENMSQTAQGVLRSLIQVHVDRYIKDHNIEGEFKFNPYDIEFRLGNIYRNTEESKVSDSEE